MRKWLPWLLVGLGCGDDTVRLYPVGSDGVQEPPGVITPEAPGSGVPGSEVPGPEVPGPDVATPEAPLPLPAAGVGQEEHVAFGGSPQTDVLAQGALLVLEMHCASCHGGGASEGGFGNVLDVQGLIGGGQVVPGSSDGSPLLARIRDGSTPAHEDLGLIESEQALVARFIDELPAGPAAACEAPPFVSLDEVFAVLSADLAQQAEPSWPFVRYVSFTYASNAGLCGAALQRQRQALFKQLNSVSTSPDIHVPEAIDELELLYRIDLRDYGWARPIDVEDDGTVDFEDGWSAAVAAAGAFAVEYEGALADAVKRGTTATIPLLPANALVHATANGELYYALVGARRSTDDTALALGLNLDSADTPMQRAGFWDQRPYRDARVSRLEQVTSPNRFYWVLEDEREVRGELLFDDPVGFERRPQVMYHLPNGLLAFGLRDPEGGRGLQVSLSCRFSNCVGIAGSNAASCQGCHSAGLFSVVDGFREGYRREGDSHGLDVAAYDALYPHPDAFQALVESDNELHLAALERAGLPRGTPDPISRVSMQFENSLDLRQVAGELGVTLERYRTNLALMDLNLIPLGAPLGKIDRAGFAGGYREALCVLHGEAETRPAHCR